MCQWWTCIDCAVCLGTRRDLRPLKVHRRLQNPIACGRDRDFVQAEYRPGIFSRHTFGLRHYLIPGRYNSPRLYREGGGGGMSCLWKSNPTASCKPVFCFPSDYTISGEKTPAPLVFSPLKNIQNINFVYYFIYCCSATSNKNKKEMCPSGSFPGPQTMPPVGLSRVSLVAGARARRHRPLWRRNSTAACRGPRDGFQKRGTMGLARVRDGMELEIHGCARCQSVP